MPDTAIQAGICLSFRTLGYSRLCGFLRGILESLDIHLSDVTLTVTAQATDGLIMARLHELPVRIAETDLARVAYRPTTGPAAAPDPLAAFRSALDDLDFGDDPPVP